MTATLAAQPVVWIIAASVVAVLVLVLKHCDSMGGPVVADARRALAAGKPAPLLKWVSPDREPELVEAFEKTIGVIQTGGQAGELAEKYLFETAVRLHRATEGASYTGLKPAESIPVSVVLADEALESGSCDELMNRITQAVREGLREKFDHLVRTRPSDEDFEAGRRWTKEYAEFVHAVLHISEAAGGLRDERRSDQNA